MYRTAIDCPGATWNNPEVRPSVVGNLIGAALVVRIAPAPDLHLGGLESAYQVFTHSFRPFTAEELTVLAECPWMLWPWFVIVDKKPAVPETQAPDGVWEAVRRRRGEMRKWV